MKKGGEYMIDKEKIVSVMVAISVMTSTFFVAMPAYAADGSTGGNFFSNFVTFFSQKFNLDKTTVQTAVNDFKTQQKGQHEQNFQNRENKRLDQLVKDGKITDAQKQAIVTELASLQSKYNADSFKNLTADQKKQRMQDEKNEVDAWAKSQNIDAKYIFPGFGMGMGMGMMGRMRHFDKWGGKITPTP